MTKLDKKSIMRKDLQKSLKRSFIDPRQLSTFQRILLTTDGTVTEMLEAYLFEKIQVAKLSMKEITLSEPFRPLKLAKGSRVISRKILLQGKVSRKNFVYAESIIIPVTKPPSARTIAPAWIFVWFVLMRPKRSMAASIVPNRF